MINAIPQIADRLLKPVQYRQESGRFFFQNHVEPIYLDLRPVVDDFHAIYDSTLGDLRDHTISIKQVRIAAQDGLKKHWGKRWDTTYYADHLRDASGYPDAVKKFASAVLGVLHISMGQRRSGSIVTLLRSAEGAIEYEAEEREKCIRTFESQQEC